MNDAGLLYKYCKPQRTCVLRDQLISFTQRTALNDIYELSPNIQFASEQHRIAREHISKTYPSINECPPTTGTEFEAEIKAILNDCLVLSLSSKWDIIPIWSHYSKNFTGFVVGFDRSNPFLVNAKAVEYTDTFPVLKKDFAAIFTKYEQWRYESEWRTFKLRSEAEPDFTKMTNVGEIFLYKFPPEAVIEVILGPKMVPDDESQFRTILSAPELSHVALLRALAGQNNWSFTKQPL